MYALLRKGYVTDVIALIVATVVLGSAVAFATAWATHGFFAGTARGILGEEGDHHVAVHVRSDMRLEARQALKALARSARWADVTEGMTILGRTNFMIDLDRAESAQFRWAISAIQDVPGYLGKTIVAEPKVTVSGLSGPAAAVLQEALSGDERIAFTLRDGTSLHLMLSSAEHNDAVWAIASELAGELHEVQVQTADGSEIRREAMLGRVQAAADAALEQGAHDGANVWAVDDGGPGGELPKALESLRRATLSWAPSVQIELEDGASVKQGDRVWLSQGSGRAEVEIAQLDGAIAIGLMVSGNLPAPGGHDGPAEGIAAVDAEGRSIGRAQALSSSAAMDRAIAAIERSTEGVADAAAAAAARAEEIDRVLSSFVGAEQAVARLKAALTSSGAGGAAPLSLNGIRLLADLADKSIKAIDRLSAVASGVSLVTSSYDGLIADLSTWRGEIAQFREKLVAIERAAGQVAGGAGLITEAAGSADAMVRALEKMDLGSLRQAVAQAGAQLEMLAGLDSDTLRNSLAQLRASAPELTGEQALALVGTIDSLYGKSGGSDQGSFVVRAAVPSVAVSDAIKAELGDGYTVYAGPAGLIARGVSAEVRSLLDTVRATIAGMVCVVLTAASLAIDHAAVASATLAMARPGRRYKGERLQAAAYSAMAGAVTLFAMAALAGGRLAGHGLWPFAPVGALLGVTAGWAAGRLAPSNRDEVEAGVAWGIGPAAIMREVVVPASRPGLLMLINRARQKLPTNAGPGRRATRPIAGNGGVELCSECRT